MRKIGMAAALVAGLLLAPMAAHAQRAKADTSKSDAAPAAPGKLTKEQKDRGMKEAPALVQAAGSGCQVTDAAFIGQGTKKTSDGKTVKQTVYEVACQQGLGYVVISDASSPKPQLFDCIASMTSNLKCQLPGNADPKAGLKSYIAATGRTCAVSDVKYVGTSSSDGTSYYEVACGPALGFRMGVPSAAGAKPTVNDCLQLLGTSAACSSQDKAAVLAAVTPSVTAPGKTCQVSDLRYLGTATASGEEYIEVACGASPGYVAVLDTAGKFKQAVDCAKADGIAGGCKMTDTTVAQTQETGVYTKLATKAGFPCQVSKYRFIGTDTKNREVVELACSDHPDGAIAIFDEKGPSTVYDCVRAGATGQECKLSSPSVVYAKYSKALVDKGKGSCKVSDARWIGRTATSDYVETACSDGLPGWVIEFPSGSEKATSLLTCREASASGTACKLKTNLAGNGGK